MRIVIDLQGAQASNKNRGIGRYTLSLAKSIVRNRGQNEVFLALNGQFPDTIEFIRAEFDELLPQDNIYVWQFPCPVSSLNPDNNWRRKAAELIREAFLASLKPDMVLVTSLFEGINDNAVTSIKNFSLSVPTAVILYDLIPLINRHPYLDNPVVEAWYENKLDHLRRADLLLAISKSSCQEGVDYLNSSIEQTINISTAVDPQFQPSVLNKKKEKDIRQRYGLLKPFIMYTGGIDHRKNIEGLIRAFSKLDKSFRGSYQLAIVCSIQPSSREMLETLAREHGLDSIDVVFTNYIPESDLVSLYNLCELFVFPSKHEGFGLPALEAMSCGAAVIASNTSSLPEVIGLDDALFDPNNDDAITNKILQVLPDNNFRKKLQQHGLDQTKLFSWDITAKRAIDAMEVWHSRECSASTIINYSAKHRLKLAYISPLPPERSGISDYSAELLPELARYYNIDVVVDQKTISSPWVHANCQIRNVEWFKLHSKNYDRILYHFGNSPFHQYMFNLLDEIPGVVVLHDFFLGHITEYIGAMSGNGDVWPATLYEEYGYTILKDRFMGDVANIAWKYPSNYRVLKKALGVIVHSNNSKRLAECWHNKDVAADWAVIPLLRLPAKNISREKSRNILSIDDDAFVVCSFGLLGKNKCNHRLLDSWIASSLSKNDKCFLIFVGESDSGEYCTKLQECINNSGLQSRIHITGWTDKSTFNHYLAAADIAVQLRTLSRGETSAAVLDCMNYGLATIINANGSMGDLPTDCVWKMPDEFDDMQLINAMEILWQDTQQRHQLGIRGREFVLRQHNPRICADQYTNAIEQAYLTSQIKIDSLIDSLSKIEPLPVDDIELINLANSLTNLILPKTSSCQQLFIDISELAQRDSKTGIQRVVRSILLELLNNPPEGYRVEPIHAIPGQGYKYARKFTLRFLGYPDCFLNDDPVEFRKGDYFLGLDLQHHVVLSHELFYQQMRNIGVKVYFVIYDLLPILLPHVFVPGADNMHGNWLKVLASSDGVLAISRAVADEIVEWLDFNKPDRKRPLKIGYFHLGADIDASTPTRNLPLDAELILGDIATVPSFLMVGTVEPRKAQTQVLSAFEQLWKQNIAINLVIVGKQGWMVDDLVHRIRNHPRFGKQLFWLEGISDEYLERVYAASSCLIAASEGEGFGLPLIEAAQHKLPIIARDIPVFREVAGEYAFYFSGMTADALASSINKWLELDKIGKAPQSQAMPWLTWKQSTQNLLDVLLGAQWYKQWSPDDIYRFWGHDSRLSSQVGVANGRAIESAGSSGYLLFGPYLALAAGQYLIKIKGLVRAGGLSGARMDAVIDKGSVILTESMLTEPGTDGFLAIVPISLDQPCTDLEVRVWVSEQTDLQVSMIEIAPWQDEPVISQIVSKDIEQKVAHVSTSTSSVIQNSSRLPSGSRNQAKSNRKKRR